MCDVKNCKRVPYVEVYFKSKTCGVEGLDCPFECNSHWSYLCFCHFVIDLVLSKITRAGRGYCYVSNRKTLLGRLSDKLEYGEVDEE